MTDSERRLQNKLEFLSENYSNEETRRTLLSCYNSKIKNIEAEVGKDLMIFTLDDLDKLFSSIKLSKGYVRTIRSFCSSYYRWGVDKGYIYDVPLELGTDIANKYLDISKTVKECLGLDDFYKVLTLIEIKSNTLSILPLLLSRYGVPPNILPDIREHDVDLNDMVIRIYKGDEVVSRLPIDDRFKLIYDKCISVKSFNGMGTRKGIIKVIPSQYVIKRTTYANNNSTEEKVSRNTILNSIMRNCTDAGINRISLSKMVLSRKLDLLLNIRESRYLIREDFENITNIFSPDYKINMGALSQRVRNFINFYKDISGEDISESLVDDPHGVEFVNDIRNSINFK